MESFNQPILLKADVSLAIKREDLLHPMVSGNKFRKLKYNLLEAKRQGLHTILTFGGAYSNHIAAVAAAGKLYGFETIGVIRGGELEGQIGQNPTLQLAVENGMRLVFVSREQYRRKTDAGFIGQMRARFGPFYLVPEGGTNDLAVQGCEEILTTADDDYDFICCPVGTGGTMAGLVRSAKPCQQVLGFAALKGDFLQAEILKFVNTPNWELNTDYHFGGYAKIDASLVAFINAFKQRHGILLDPVYTGKMLFGVMELIDKGYFPAGSKILAIHTGGLQGIEGMNAKLKEKKLPIIQ
ncbi:1-aminocyclopropane-1-carboxylate deaminase/D-cysteine desulfhydrase [Flavobacterium caeni]|uniref:1-aminocyclopropane-1-carboxylate deaminase n=1 Tax=Flavobacterium caeni TaxID=490189 RepID=A0A1G5J508_9FLAO|nr:pyridoxal-phosphate dependent enzyme [Flavobacterium caeni]SCY82919.1 1-aminocyclopropane-1-carboxylate deaminase [Flavobacterium caeni]